MAELEKRLDGKRTPVKVSVLGCVVNGPGEAREADLGIAAGRGKGVLAEGQTVTVVTTSVPPNRTQSVLDLPPLDLGEVLTHDAEDGDILEEMLEVRT